MITYDQKTFDSAGAFFTNNLIKIDSRLKNPLFRATWNRDIPILSGLVKGIDSTAFDRSSFASGSSVIPWMGPRQSTAPAVQVDTERVITKFRYVARNIEYMVDELIRAQLLGLQLSMAQTDAINMAFQLDADKMVYQGDTAQLGSSATGLVNSTIVTSAAVANGASGSPLWASKTPDEIVEDISSLFNAVEAACGEAIRPDTLLLPTSRYNSIASRKVSGSADKTILEYVREKISGTNGPITVNGTKWLEDAGAGNGTRMIAYVKQEDFVRFPMLSIYAEGPLFQKGSFFSQEYKYGLGQVEIVYPEAIAYRDGF